MDDIKAAFDRAYPAQANRQQSHDRLVHTPAELVRVLGMALAPGLNAPDVATIRLGADVYLDEPIVLDGTYGVVVDGGGQYGIGCSPSFVGTEMFQAVTVNDLLFRDIAFTGPTAKIERLIHFTSGSARSLNFERVTMQRIKRIFEGSSVPLYTDSTFSQVQMSGLSLTDVTDIGSAQYVRCQFEHCYARLPSSTTRRIDVTSQAGSSHLVLIEAGTSTSSTSAVELYDFDTSQLYRLRLTKNLIVGSLPASLSSIDTSSAMYRNGALQWVLQGTVNTTGGTGATVASFTPTASRCYLVTAHITGRRTNGADQGAAYIVCARVKVDSVGAVTVAAPAALFSSEDDVTWDSSIDTSAGDVRVRASGFLAQNITWTATVTIDEV